MLMFSCKIRRLLLPLNALLALLCSPAFSAPYLVNPGDILRIDVWNEELLSREVLVRPDGIISLPIAGAVDTSNSTPSKVGEDVGEALGKFMRDVPQVVVSLVSVSGNKIYVIGKVARPGEMNITSETDVMQALAQAGGLTTFAAENDILILRRQTDGTQTAIPFEYAEVKSGEELHTNIILQSRDIVVVP
jgi:polysaccharide export outer membrane protein